MPNETEFDRSRTVAFLSALFAVEHGRNDWHDDELVTDALLAIAHTLLLKHARHTHRPVAEIIFGWSTAVMQLENGVE